MLTATPVSRNNLTQRSVKTHMHNIRCSLQLQHVQWLFLNLRIAIELQYLLHHSGSLSLLSYSQLRFAHTPRSQQWLHHLGSSNGTLTFIMSVSPVDSDSASLFKCRKGHLAGCSLSGEFLLSGCGTSQQARGGSQVCVMRAVVESETPIHVWT